MAEIASARRRRGAVCGRLNRIEKGIAKMEGKEMLGPSDKRKIKRLLEHVKDDDKEFEERHLKVLVYSLVIESEHVFLFNELLIVYL